MTLDTDRISAAQIPQMIAMDDPDEPRAVEIGVGGETLYAEALGFPRAASVLISLYVSDNCALEIAVPIDEAVRLADQINLRTKELYEHLAN